MDILFNVLFLVTPAHTFEKWFRQESPSHFCKYISPRGESVPHFCEMVPPKGESVPHFCKVVSPKGESFPQICKPKYNLKSNSYCLWEQKELISASSATTSISSFEPKYNQIISRNQGHNEAKKSRYVMN